MLVEAVHSLCKGVVTDRVDNFLKQLTQQPQPESTKLYARTLDVDIANLKGLAAAHGGYTCMYNTILADSISFTGPEMNVGCPKIYFLL